MGHYPCYVGKKKSFLFSNPSWFEQNEQVICLYSVQMTELLTEPWPTYSTLIQGGEGSERKTKSGNENAYEDRERERDKLRKKQRAEQVCERLEQRGTGGAAMLCRGRQSERENENVFPSRRN